MAASTACRRLIVWCRGCRHRVEPDPAQLAQRSGAPLGPTATSTPAQGANSGDLLDEKAAPPCRLEPYWHRRNPNLGTGSRQTPGGLFPRYEVYAEPRPATSPSS